MQPERHKALYDHPQPERAEGSQELGGDDAGVTEGT